MTLQVRTYKEECLETQLAPQSWNGDYFKLKTFGNQQMQKELSLFD